MSHFNSPQVSPTFAISISIILLRVTLGFPIRSILKGSIVGQNKDVWLSVFWTCAPAISASSFKSYHWNCLSLSSGRSSCLLSSVSHQIQMIFHHFYFQKILKLNHYPLCETRLTQESYQSQTGSTFIAECCFYHIDPLPALIPHVFSCPGCL